MGDPLPDNATAGRGRAFCLPVNDGHSMAETLQPRLHQRTLAVAIFGLALVASRRLGLVISLSCFFFVAGLPGRCADFELCGRSTFENFKPDGSKYTNFSGTFSVQKSSEHWLIVSFDDGTPTTEHVMFDGVDVYTLTRNMVMDKEQVARFPGSEKDLVYTNGIAYSKSSTASVFSGEYPLGAQCTARLLWLAFLSGQALSRPEPARIPAPWGVAYMPGSRSFILNVEWSLSNSVFPMKTRFVASTELWTNSFREWKFSPVVTEPSPFEDKHLAGVYQVTTWTNVHNGNENLVVPLTFSVERYYPPQITRVSIVAERYSGRVTKVALTKPVINYIEPSGHVDVFDYRFMNKTLPWFYVQYPITNKTWKTTNDPDVRESIEPAKARFIEASSMAEYVPLPHSRPQGYARACFALLILSGPVIVLLIWIRKKVNKQNERDMI